jgi:hypothetical protein
MVLRASPAAFAQAFGVSFGVFERAGETSPQLRRPDHAGPRVAPVVQAVIGLDDARVARPASCVGARPRRHWR